jgi:hypothetical protein
MTIIASVKVRDGLVLGTDSMTQIWGANGFLKSYANARKLFQINELPIGVMTHGTGNIGDRSIEGVVLDLCSSVGAALRSVPDMADLFFEHVHPLYEAAFPDEDARQPLGFFIGGYSPEAATPETYEFMLPLDTAPRVVHAEDATGASWRGIFAPVAAIMRGMSPGVQKDLLDGGMSSDDVDELAAKHGMTVVFRDAGPGRDRFRDLHPRHNYRLVEVPDRARRVWPAAADGCDPPGRRLAVVGQLRADNDDYMKRGEHAGTRHSRVGDDYGAAATPKPAAPDRAACGRWGLSPSRGAAAPAVASAGAGLGFGTLSQPS